MRDETGNQELNERLAKLDAREQAVELYPGTRPLEPEEQELARSLSQLTHLQTVVLAIIIAIACLLTMLIALGHIRLPTWARPEPIVEPEVVVESPGPITQPAIPPPEMFEASQYIHSFDAVTDMLRQHTPADFLSMVAWRYNIGGKELSQPVYARDGSAYLASSGTVYAFTSEGELKWSWRPDADGAGAPALGPDGQLYAAGSHGTVYALSQGGDVQWSFKPEGQVSGGPLPATNGLVYIKTRIAKEYGLGYIYALSQSGHERWRYEPPYAFDHHPLILGQDSAVYDLNKEGMLLRVNQHGKADWQVDVGTSIKGPVVTPMAVVISQRAPAGSDHYWQLSALSPASGRELWDYALPTEPNSTPIAGPDGTIYAACYYQPPENRSLPYHNGVWAIAGDGNLAWQRDFPVHDRIRPLFARDGQLFAAGWDGSFVLDSKGDIILGLPERDDFPEIIGPGPGKMVYAQREGELFVLRTD